MLISIQITKINTISSFVFLHLLLLQFRYSITGSISTLSNQFLLFLHRQTPHLMSCRQRRAKSSNSVTLKIQITTKQWFWQSKLKIITNYEFLKSKSIQKQVILKIIFKITFRLWVSNIYNNFTWVIYDFSCQTGSWIVWYTCSMG